MAIRVAYYFSYRAYLVLYWPDSDFENHLQLDAGVEPVTEPRALGAFINLMGKAGYAPILISRQYGILRGSNCTSKAARQSVGSWGDCPIYNCGAQEARGTLRSRWPSNQVNSQLRLVAPDLLLAWLQVGSILMDNALGHYPC